MKVKTIKMPTRSKIARGKLNFDRYGYLFIFPYVFGLLTFIAYPILYTIFMSFTNLRGLLPDYKIIGLSNYTRLLHDDFFWRSFLNTWKLWIPNFILQIGFALVLGALFTDIRLKIKGGSFFRTIFYMPNLITAASIAILFEAFFSFPNGPVNQLLTQIGIMKKSFQFFTNPTATSLLVSFIQFWMWYGQTLIIVYAGMVGIPSSLYEAAMVDGSNSRQTFFKITLPMLKPVIIYILITSLVGGMQLFDIPFLITDGIGSPDQSIMTMTMYLYKHGFTGINNYSYAATVAVGQFIVIMVCSIIIRWLLRDKDSKSVRKGA
jgi:ABC-type sugar transport system permease subunit